MTSFTIAERAVRPHTSLALLRWALVVVFIWFGCMKFTAYEAHGIAPLMMNSPFLSWLPAMLGVQGASYVIGILEPRPLWP